MIGDWCSFDQIPLDLERALVATTPTGDSFLIFPSHPSCICTIHCKTLPVCRRLPSTGHTFCQSPAATSANGETGYGGGERKAGTTNSMWWQTGLRSDWAREPCGELPPTTSWDEPSLKPAIKWSSRILMCMALCPTGGGGV